METAGAEMDPWAWESNEISGMHGDFFVRTQAEARLLARWLEGSWHEAAQGAGQEPSEFLAGIKLAARRIGDRFIDHVVSGYWIELDEGWIDQLRREKGVAQAGANQANRAVNLEEELTERLEKWMAGANAEDAVRRGKPFLIGAVLPIQAQAKTTPARIPPGQSLEEMIGAQCLLEAWHECYVELFDPLRPKLTDEETRGVRFAVLDAMAQVLPEFKPTAEILHDPGFQSYMRTAVLPRWRAHYTQATGQEAGTLRHLALLDECVQPGSELASLAKGKGRAPTTAEQRLQEAFFGRAIQVVHEAEGRHFFLGAGLVDPLLMGLALGHSREPTRLLRIQHEEYTSVAILLPAVGAFNVGLGGWLVLPFYWSPLGSVGPSRQLRAEATLERFEERFHVETILANSQEFMDFLQKQEDIGTPIWLRDENIRASALEWERQLVLPAAQSLVLELLAERFAWQILKCNPVHTSLSLGPLECDIVGLQAGEVHHIECANSIGQKELRMPQEFQRKAEALANAFPGRAVRQYFVTKRRGAGNVAKVVADLEAAGVRIVTFDEDLKPLVPKKFGGDRLARVFHNAQDDPVWNTQQALAELQVEMARSELQKPPTGGKPTLQNRPRGRKIRAA